MRNYIQPGNNITIPASPYAVDSGEGVLIGQLFGIACGDAENGAEVTFQTEGVFDIAKPANVLFNIGDAVFFDAALKQARAAGDSDSNSAGDYEAQIGVAIAAAGAGASTVRVRLGVPVALA